MKKKLTILISLAALVLFIGAVQIGNHFIDKENNETIDDTEKERVLMEVTTKILDLYHYNDVKLDNDFSARIFDIYLERLDFNKRFLIREDVEKLSDHRVQIDEQIDATNYKLLNESVKLLKERIELVRGFYEEILAEPFDYEKDEVYQMDPEKLEYATSKKELKDRWRQSLKYQVIVRLHEMMDTQESAKEKSDTSVTIKPFDELEKEARKKVLKSHNDWFHRIDQLNRNDRISGFLNAVSSAYDPHTAFYPPKDKENFDIAISGQLEGIGATLQEKDGFIKVVRIVPGSASWRQGDLEAGDIILKVAQGDEEPVDVVDMRLDEAVQLIRGPKGTEVRLTVKKVDGTIKVISIIRDIVILDEVYAKSAVIDNKETGKKIGYIRLPKFYADFNKKGGRSCADDVKKELIKLKGEDVEGVVLDLRNNGGGSLYDVVEMMGLFIKSGPIVQVKSRDGAPYVLEDEKESVLYDGPLAIMVNEYSASASEILAAAVQDYKRGVIIGSEQTHGKGTVQRIIDMDKYLPADLKFLSPLGAVKLTTQKFYRVNGGATQLKGVQSDIVLPDSYSKIPFGEDEEEYSLPWDEIEPADYELWRKPMKNIELLQKESQERVDKNRVFSLIEQNATRLKNINDNTTYSLNFKEFRKKQEELSEEAEKYDNIMEPIEEMDVNLLTVDLQEIEADTSKKARMEAWAKELKKDVYVFESSFVIDDLIDLGIAKK